MTTNDNSNDLDKEKRIQESKDDWVINDNDNVNSENGISIEAPSFIRLFVIRRIIDKYIKNNKEKKKKTKEEIIKQLSNVFKDDKQNQLLVINIVTRLIDDGIKKYMSKYYNEKEQANIIEDIFNKIILNKFKQEYNKMIKCGINNEITNNFYQHLLFNSSDLMNQIFQYLEWGEWLDGDLFECSLVSSHWLYHVWNVNSVYHIDLCMLIEDDGDNKQKWTRIWQRLYNVKSIYINFDTHADDSKVEAMVNKLSVFRKIEKVDVVGPDVSPVMRIMSRCKDTIKSCRIKIRAYFSHLSCFEEPSPLRLPKAQYVEIGDLFFHRGWTNECTQLKLSELDNINKDWCKFVIENCDCSNVTTLTLYNVTFDDKSINEVILKQLGSKFCNIKTLEISIFFNVDDNVLLLWQLLKPIISKNKTQVKLEVDFLTPDQEILLSKRMDEKDLKIDKLIIGDIRSYDDIKFIRERDNGHLNHLAIEQAISISQTQKLLDEWKCQSITTFEWKTRASYSINNMNFVNSLLKWKMITEKQIFVIVDVYGNYNKFGDCDAYLSSFKQLYENVYQLFVQQIALDIKIKLKGVQDSAVFSSYLSLYSSYFRTAQFLSQYNSPKCNSNLCLPRDKPYTYFYIHGSQKGAKFFVFSASNVQMR